MVEIGIEEAKKFLNEINKGEKVAIIHHDDTDGFVSAILLYEFLEKRGVKDIGHFCFSIGDNQRSIIEKVSSYETILIADLAPNAITNVLEAIKNKKVLYIDHHKKDVEIPEKILEYRTESKISASRSIFTMVGGQKDLEISALLSDVGYSFPEYKERIENFAREEGLEVKELMNKYYFRIDLFLAYFYKEIDNAFDVLRNIKDLNELKKYSDAVEKEAESLTKGFDENKERLGKVNYYFFETKYPLKSRITTEISFRYPKEVFVFATPHVKKEGSIAVSARNQSGEVDCNELLRVATEGLIDASGGGHPKAAGGYIRKEDLEEFKKRIEKISKKDK